MKLPFRPRSDDDDDQVVEQYTDGGLDTVGLASGQLGRSVLNESSYELDGYDGYDDERYGPLPSAEGGDHYGEQEHGGYGSGPVGRGQGLISRRRRRSSRLLEAGATGEIPLVPADSFAEEMERLQSDAASSEQRSAWAYLGVLGGLFVLLSGFGWACSDPSPTEVAVGPASEAAGGGEPVHLVVRVEGDVVALQGAVPDEAAETQLLEVAGAVYGIENVVDEIEVDDGTTFESGTVRFVGSADAGDGRPEDLQERVVGDFGLTNRGFEVGSVSGDLSPVDVTMAVDGNRVVLTGVLPDDPSVTALVGLAGEVWGVENVDGTGLSTGSTTWTEGVVRLTGSASSSDQRVTAFASLVPTRIDALATVDTSGLSAADDPAEVSRVQSEVNELVLAEPIQFAPDSTDIVADSDDVLTRVAELLAEVPSTPFEVVGHTDSVGDDQENQVLSEDRAEAVLDRLIELGVPVERMTSRGEGESKPIADNTTDEGKAANRRIEFRFLGTSGSVGDTGSADDDGSGA